jgi:hypothetical protein
MSLSTALASQVTGEIRDRGRQYYHSGAVTIRSATPTAVVAAVRGTGRYSVDLALDGRTVFASCTCPYVDEFGNICKHIWATILAAEQRGFAAREAASGSLQLVLDQPDDYDDDGYDDGYDDPRYDPPAYRSPPPVSSQYRHVPARENWKGQLDELQRQLQPPGYAYSQQVRPVERQLVYIVDGPTSTQVRQLVLEVAARERKLNGEWGKPKAHSVSPSQVAELTDPIDRQLLTLLGGAERGDGYSYGYYNYGSSSTRYRLAAPMVAAALPILAQTDRLRLRTDPKQPELQGLVADPGPPWELAVTVAHDARGKNWVVTGALRRGDETMPLEKTALVVPGLVIWDHHFAALNDSGAFAWVPLLRRVGTITVPVAKGDDLLAQLLQMPRLPRLELPEELRYAEESVPPRPRLVVKAPDSRWGQPVLHGELSFLYDGQVVPAQPPGRGVFRPDRKQLLLRDADAERAAAQELTRLGFRPG